jgi:hypothetical protein
MQKLYIYLIIKKTSCKQYILYTSRKNILEKPPHLDLALARTALLASKHRQDTTCQFFPLEVFLLALWQSASCLSLLTSDQTSRC